MQGLVSFIPLILILLFFYFFVIRPQNKQQKEIKDMRSSLKPGDEVVTIGGFYGIIYAIDENNVVLEMLPDFNKLMVTKSAIAKVITPAEESPAAEEIEDEVSEDEPVVVEETEEKVETVSDDDSSEKTEK